jgi:hypothetical protein
MGLKIANKEVKEEKLNVQNINNPRPFATT